MEEKAMIQHKMPNLYVLFRTIGEFFEKVEVPKTDKPLQELKEDAEKALELVNEIFYPSVLGYHCRCIGGNPKERPTIESKCRCIGGNPKEK